MKILGTILLLISMYGNLGFAATGEDVSDDLKTKVQKMFEDHIDAMDGYWNRTEPSAGKKQERRTKMTKYMGLFDKYSEDPEFAQAIDAEYKKALEIIVEDAPATENISSNDTKKGKRKDAMIKAIDKAAKAAEKRAKDIGVAAAAATPQSLAPAVPQSLANPQPPATSGAAPSQLAAAPQQALTSGAAPSQLAAPQPSAAQQTLTSGAAPSQPSATPQALTAGAAAVPQSSANQQLAAPSKPKAISSASQLPIDSQDGKDDSGLSTLEKAGLGVSIVAAAVTAALLVKKFKVVEKMKSKIAEWRTGKAKKKLGTTTRSVKTTRVK